jgi:hypothetical protein
LILGPSDRLITRCRDNSKDEDGSVLVLAVGALLGFATLLVLLIAVGRVYVQRAELQQAVDVAGETLSQSPDLGGMEAEQVARENGADSVEVEQVDAGRRVLASVNVDGPMGVGQITLTAKSRVVEDAVMASAGSALGRMYSGPLVRVDSASVCPAVAADYRAMERSAAAAGITITAISGYRSESEQAVLFARLGPRLAAPPGRSLHHAATELDLVVGFAGSATHTWLRRNAPSHNFIQRYSWEPWHWGNTRGC